MATADTATSSRSGNSSPVRACGPADRTPPRPTAKARMSRLPMRMSRVYASRCSRLDRYVAPRDTVINGGAAHSKRREASMLRQRSADCPPPWFTHLSFKKKLTRADKPGEEESEDAA